MTPDIYTNIRNTPLWPLVRISDDYYVVNFGLRKYHSAAHASDVVSAVNELTDHNPSIALILAAQWHDAVYFPNAGSDANERCSSAALGIEARNIARGVDLSRELKDAVNQAQELIENTSVGVHLTSKYEGAITGSLAILLDADLSSLAAPWEQFLQNQANIITENGGTVDDSSYRKCAEFLRSFLICRPYIYHTDAARALWEKSAVENIQRLCRNTAVEIDVD